MALYKCFKKVPSALPSSNGSLSGGMLSEAISSANCEMSGSINHDTALQSFKIYYKKLFLRYALAKVDDFSAASEFIKLKPFLIQFNG